MQTGNFMVTSPDFIAGKPIPSKFSTHGEDVNPEIKISGVPQGTKSLALAVHDPDAPNGTWYHWLVKDIPPECTEIKQNSVPGTQVTNSWGIKNYKGPKPPSGTHRYFYTIYALDIPTFHASDPESFFSSIKEHILAEQSYMGVFSHSTGKH